MKTLLTVVCCSVMMLSCKKEAEPNCADGTKNQDEIYADCGGSCTACPIDYPETGWYGTNLLNGSDTLFVGPGNYSFRANVPTGSSLKVTASNVSGQAWLYGTNDGWGIGTPSNSQTFEVLNAGTAELLFNLNNGTGTTLFQFFENGTTITKERVVVWG